MKALTLTQPYAALVANGDKVVETRSWRASYRGPVLIHAAASLKGVGGKHGYVEALHHVPDLALLKLDRNAFKTPALEGAVVPPGLPLGAIVAVSFLEDCEEIDETLRASLDADELAVGNYADGRYAWRLRRAIEVAPVFCKGALGLWDFPDDDLPRHVERACRAIQHAVVGG